MPRLITHTVVTDFRNRLCDVAAELFAQMGRDGFNMRELAKRLRVSPMTAYRYFRDKEEILAALRARAFARFADRLEQTQAAPAPRHRTAAFANAYREFVRQEEACYRLMFDLFQPEIQGVPELAVEERRAFAVMTEHARLMVRDGLWNGEPEMMGRVLWSALHGVAALHLANKLSDFDATLTETVRVLANGWRDCHADPQAEEWPALAVHEQPPIANYHGMAALPAE